MITLSLRVALGVIIGYHIITRDETSKNSKCMRTVGFKGGCVYGADRQRNNRRSNREISWILKMKLRARGKGKSKVLPLLCFHFNLAFAYMGYFEDYSGRNIFRK